MPLPKPEPGLVIHFEYLWRHEHEAGLEQGRKRRPCAIILAVDTASGGPETVVAPMTHTPPRPPSVGVEIPLKVKRHLGLDDEPSWVIVTDLNVFVWPGVDLHPVPGAPPGVFDYGFLPPRLFEQIRAAVNAAGGIAKATHSTA
jgi:hypothetical protein